MKSLSLRSRMLRWHTRAFNTFDWTELLRADFQSFRKRVCNRTGKDLDFREAIEQADEKELQYLDMQIYDLREERKRDRAKARKHKRS